MSYAEVSVNSPICRYGTLSYAVPSGISIYEGCGVWVPFGTQTRQGIVTSFSEAPGVPEVKDILGLIQPKPLLSAKQLNLAKWISAYYLCPLYDAIALFLPPAFERKPVVYFKALQNKDVDNTIYNVEEQKVIRLISERGKMPLKELEKLFSKAKAQRTASKLIKAGVIERIYEVQEERVKPKFERFISLNTSPAEALAEAEKLSLKKAHKQAEALTFLAKHGGETPFQILKQETGASGQTVKTLILKGFVKEDSKEVKRKPYSLPQTQTSKPLKLNDDQQKALDSIRSSIIKESVQNKKADIFLLHGVTGSGKTEVYMQSAKEAIKLGKKVIVLVPEISLATQIIKRFASRFPAKVAVMHSQMSLGERYDEWREIEEGGCDIVIGPRSALFSPLKNVGLIILDEEHEWAYKQTETPTYHARTVAIKMAQGNGATLVLGSATPDVESTFRAQKGHYTLLKLPVRITSRADSSMPHFSVVDMKSELKGGNRSIFSRELKTALAETLTKGEQAILFHNRRGSSICVHCDECGYSAKCPRCSTSLHYHSASEALICHQCSYKRKPPLKCPDCDNENIKYLGLGTQKLENEIKALFPKAQVLRWDSDSAKTKKEQEDIFESIESGKADIIIGTQILAKGLDLPKVTLVGVIDADTALAIPDFRSAERTFQLLSQVSGRAGRARLKGKAVIQTYMPKNYAIQAAAGNNYDAFYNKEIEYRQALSNPPFSQLAVMTYSHTNSDICRSEAEKVKRVLTEKKNSTGTPNLLVIGPVPAFVERFKGKYRWQVLIKGVALPLFLKEFVLQKGWHIEIDPFGI